ncbi:MAG: PAS domain S-box protein [Bacteroidales bacterium]
MSILAILSVCSELQFCFNFLDSVMMILIAERSFLYQRGLVILGLLFLIILLLLWRWFRKELNKKSQELVLRNQLLESSNRMLGELLDEKKFTEQKLRNSESLYRLLVENQTDLVVKVDRNGKFLFVSQSYCKLFGKTQDELLHKTFLPFVHPDDQEPTRVAMKSLYKKPWKCFFEQRAMTVNGWRWIAWSDTAVLNNDNEVVEIIGVGRDITEQKRSDEEWRLLMNQVIDSDPSSIAVHDKDLRYLHVSKRYLDDYNLKAKNIIGKHHYEVFPDIPEKWKKVHQRGLKGEVLKEEEDVFYRSDGKIDYTRWECKPWYKSDHSIGGIILYTEVITLRKQYEINLKKQRDRLHLLLDIVAAVGKSENYRQALNITLQKICSNSLWEMGEVWEKNIETERLVPGESWYSVDERLQSFRQDSKNYSFGCGEGLPGKAWKTRYTCWMFDLDNNTDFQRHQLAAKFGVKTGVAIPVMDEKRIVNIMVFFSRKELEKDEVLSDIFYGTALHLGELFKRKLAEHNMVILNRSLEEKVKSRTQQLEVTNKELEAFSYSVSHDLRAPLRAITGFTQILSNEYEELFDEEATRLFGIIKENAQTMDTLISDLLDFSRTGRVQLSRSEINMKDMSKALFYEISTEKQRQTIDLLLENLPDANADPSLMRQVWRNLLSNAIKYSQNRDHPRIHIGGHNKEKENIYFVKDNGVGFNPAYTSKLFQVFQRLHKSNEFEGTGVGLAIVQRIILKHGGRVWAKGEINKGACFWFSLPASK